jgi:histidine ammonia-lyase
MSIEARFGNLKLYNTKLHELRGFAGAIISARYILKVIEGSDLTT